MKIKKLKLKFRENFSRKYYSLNRRRNWRWKLQQLFRSNISKQSQLVARSIVNIHRKFILILIFFFFFFEKGIFIFERVKFNSSELINRSTSLIVIPARAYSVSGSLFICAILSIVDRKFETSTFDKLEIDCIYEGSMATLERKKKNS